MKYLILASILSLSCSLSFGQSLSISVDDVYVAFGENVDWDDVVIENISDFNLDVFVTLQKRCYQADDDATVSIQWGDSTFAPTNENIVVYDFDLTYSVAINSGQTYGEFSFEQYAGTEAHGQIWRVYFFNAADPLDQVFVDIHIDTCADEDIVVGVEDSPIANVEVFPNPATDHLMINCEGRFEYKLFDISGNLVLSNSAVGQNQLSVSGLESGVYILSVLADNGTGKVQKVMIH
jgi:hypothetical protein